MIIQIPLSELKIKFARSGGSGGQNVNKVSSKAQVWWDVDASKVVDAEQKARIKQVLGNRIKEGGLFLEVDEERDQIQNKRRALKRLHDLVNEAIIPEEERIPTEPTTGAKERRLEDKSRQARRKSARRWRPE